MDSPLRAIIAIELVLITTAALTSEISLLMIQEFILVLLSKIDWSILNVHYTSTVSLFSVALICLFSI